MTARYALYLTPPPDHPLYDLGQHLLGRNAHYGGPLPQPRLRGISPNEIALITAAPRHYGFHATLKPPFVLADGTSAEELHAAAETFAAGQSPFTVPALEVAVLDGFVALAPVERCPLLHAFADRCVGEFDRFRAPPGDTELERRRAAGLSTAQEAMLIRWGYPYVFDEFRPHFSLTERIDDNALRVNVVQAIRAHLPADTLRNVPVDALCLFGQPNARMPFYETARFEFGA